MAAITDLPIGELRGMQLTSAIPIDRLFLYPLVSYIQERGEPAAFDVIIHEYLERTIIYTYKEFIEMVSFKRKFGNSEYAEAIMQDAKILLINKTKREL